MKREVYDVLWRSFSNDKNFYFKEYDKALTKLSICYKITSLAIHNGNFDRYKKVCEIEKTLTKSANMLWEMYKQCSDMENKIFNMLYL